MNEGLYKKETYINYSIECVEYKNNLMYKLKRYKFDDKNIIGVGSTAKSNVVFNFAKIDNTIIDYIIDENSLKQNHIGF